MTKLFDRLQRTIDTFTFTERILFYGFVALLVLSTLLMLVRIHYAFSEEVPIPGGHLTEGIIGTPRFINPVLARSDADRDLTMLVYSGLLAAQPDGTLIPNLAEEYSLSEDKLTYIFTIRDDAVFHDGTPVTADDVVFTVELAQDPSARSPKRFNWEGVSATKVSDKKVSFTLAEPYAPFLENATLGILPKHIWESVPKEQTAFSTFNVEPIGSGPFRVSDIQRDGAGVPQYYMLEPFSDYTLGEPYLRFIQMRFYANEQELVDALKSGEVDHINSPSPIHAEELSKEEAYRIRTFPLPRVFGVFFNQDAAPLFINKEVRVALDEAINREQIVDQVLAGYGVPVDDPLPPGVFDVVETGATEQGSEEARAILERNGWEMNEELGILTKETDDDAFALQFSLATANIPELKETAQTLKEQWEKIGAGVELEFFDSGTLNSEVIRPRDYSALLFGQIIGRDKDPFAFWHSSQRNDPGLNVALYANIEVDGILEDIRTTFDEEEREKLFRAFLAEIETDVPGVFLYSPDFIYVLNSPIRGIELGTVTTAAERFLTVHKWHTQTHRVWKLFAK